MRPASLLRILATLFASAPPTHAQPAASSANLPRVVIPASRMPGQAPAQRSRLYPWRKNITATVFWIGEQANGRNPTPNLKSSWDQEWMKNFGGYDDPDPEKRVASHRTSDFRPKAFIPKLNPFYIALPYNDVAGWGRHKREASKVIPWFRRMNPEPGKTVLKGRWIEIYHGGRSCYAQWEDCGPWVTDDWQYVFANRPPKNRNNKQAGIDISPAIRDYLGLKSGEKCHWRFVEDSQVPHGPWKKYGQPRSGRPADFEAKRRYFETLRRLRDERYSREGGS